MRLMVNIIGKVFDAGTKDRENKGMKDLGQGWRQRLANRGLDNNFGRGLS
jgi:hypothetical protein